MRWHFVVVVVRVFVAVALWAALAALVGLSGVGSIVQPELALACKEIGN